MNLATTATPNRRIPQRRSWGLWWKSVRIPTIFFGFVVFIAAGITYLNATHVSGIEIHCQDWQIRRFSFRRDPFTNYQLTGLKYSRPPSSDLWAENASMTGAILDPTIATYLKRDPDFESRWDLVRLHGSTPSSGPAMILFDLLAMHDPNYTLFWKTWTTANPAKAKILWPAAQDLTRFKLYSRIPKLFELAVVELSVNEFDASVKSVVAPALFDTSRDAPNSELSAKAMEVAKGYVDNSSDPSKPFTEAR